MNTLKHSFSRWESAEESAPWLGVVVTRIENLHAVINYQIRTRI